MRRTIILTLTLLAALAAYAATPPRLTRAIESQRELAASRPQDVQVLNDLGNLLVLAGEIDEADTVYQQALSLDPDSAVTHYNLALLYQQLGKGHRALRHYRQVIALDPGHARAHYQLGTLYEGRGMESRAVEHYATALALDPSLAFPEVNPHVLDNRLLTKALLTAHAEVPAAALAPRIYQEPMRIAGLLLPASAAGRGPGVEEADPRAAGAPTRTVWESGDDDGEARPGAPDPRDPDAPYDPRAPVVVEIPAGERTLTPSDLEQSRAGQVQGGVLIQPAPGAPGAARGGVRTAPGEGVVTEEAPRWIPYQPGVPSTGRLDLELVPVERLRIAARPPPVRR